MLLGKRPRPPIKRTTSMTGITVDLNNAEAPAPSDPQNPIEDLHKTGGPEGFVTHNIVVGPNGFDPRLLATVSPRNPRRNSGDFLETPHFLRTCGLCKSRLAPGRDIYMYRGDTAFCSLECREQQMKQDERKDKCSVLSKKEDHHAAASTAASKASSKSETVAAA